jgi:hypothetical protein
MAGKLPDTATEEEKAEHGKLLKRLQRFNTPADAAKALREQDKLISSGQLKKALPKNATDAQVSEWRKENGIPESADKYDLTGLEFSDDEKPVVDAFVKGLHGVNATPEQVKGALAAFADIKASQGEKFAAANNAARTAVEDELRVDWGTDYRPNVDAVKSMLENAGSEVADSVFKARGPDGVQLMNNPSVIRWFAAHARELGFVSGTVVPAGGDVGKSNEDAIAEIEKSMFNADGTKSDAYWKSEKAQARYMALLETRDRRDKN